MYSKEEQTLIWLSSFDLPYKKQEQLMQTVGLVDLIDKIDCKKVREILDKDFERVLKDASKEFLNSYLNALEEQKVVCLTIESKNYPEKLRVIENPPFVIFAKGNLSFFNDRAVGIVGTRMPSNYGRLITEKFATELAGAGLVIVSGLAFGVDSISHSSAMKAKGKTIAVIGSGFNYLYPDGNRALADEISEKGLLISEYRPSMRAQRFTFPQRNRIIAALSEGILITEAGEKSGALHTKNYALDYGKEVFVVPGNINSAKSAGTNNVIRSMQGSCVLDPNDILERLGIKFGAKTKKVVQLSINEEMITNALKDGETTLEELTEKTKLSINNIVSCLTMLEIRGIIKKLPGNTYIKNDF